VAAFPAAQTLVSWDKSRETVQINTTSEYKRYLFNNKNLEHYGLYCFL